MKEKLYCGVDVHSKTSYFCIMDQLGIIKMHQETYTDIDSIERILSCYHDYEIQYAFETGNMTRYFNNVVRQQYNTGVIHVVNTNQFKAISGSKHKNDKEDSRKLADGLLKGYLPKPVHIKSDKCRQLQMLLNLRKGRVNNKVRLVNQLKAILRGAGIKQASKGIQSDKSFQRAVA